MKGFRVQFLWKLKVLPKIKGLNKIILWKSSNCSRKQFPRTENIFLAPNSKSHSPIPNARLNISSNEPDRKKMNDASEPATPRVYSHFALHNKSLYHRKTNNPSKRKLCPSVVIMPKVSWQQWIPLIALCRHRELSRRFSRDVAPFFFFLPFLAFLSVSPLCIWFFCPFFFFHFFFAPEKQGAAINLGPREFRYHYLHRRTSDSRHITQTIREVRVCRRTVLFNRGIKRASFSLCRGRFPGSLCLWNNYSTDTDRELATVGLCCFFTGYTLLVSLKLKLNLKLKFTFNNFLNSLRIARHLMEIQNTYEIKLWVVFL